MFPRIGGYPPKSSIFIGCSIINHPFWGYPYFWKHSYTIDGVLLVLDQLINRLHPIIYRCCCIYRESVQQILGRNLQQQHLSRNTALFSYICSQISLLSWEGQPAFPDWWFFPDNISKADMFANSPSTASMHAGALLGCIGCR